MNARQPSQRRAARAPKGNALLYTLLALVLGGIGLAVGVQQYQDAERSTSVQSTVGEVNAIIGAAKQNFGQYGYAGLNTGIAVGSQVIPRALHDATGGTATNRFGGAVNMGLGPVPGTGSLTYVGVPSNVCTSIVNGTQALARQVTVGGTDAKPMDGLVNVGQLNAGCISGNAVTIVWVIGRT